MMPDGEMNRDGGGGQAPAAGSYPSHPGGATALITLWQQARWGTTEAWKSDARQVQLQIELRAKHGHQPKARMMEFDRTTV